MVPKAEDLAAFETPEQWNHHIQRLLQSSIEHLSCKSANPGKFENDSIPIQKLNEIAAAAVDDILRASQNDLIINYLSDSLTWEEEPLDMGSHTRQMLLQNKSMAYRDVNQPHEQA